MKDEFTGLASEISYLVGKITELEDNVRVLLNKRMDKISGELKKVKISRKVFSRYFNSEKDNKGKINIIE